MRSIRYEHIMMNHEYLRGWKLFKDKVNDMAPLITKQVSEIAK